MTVLFLIENAGGGGTESFVATLAEEYIKLGHRCLLGFSVPGPLSERAQALGMETVQLGLGRADFFKAPKELAKICREKNVEVIHAQFPRENVLAVRAAKLCPGLKVVYTDHMSVPQGRKWRILNRRYCSRDEFAAAVWEGGRRVLEENGVPADRIRVIPNGVSEVPDAAANRAEAATRLKERFDVPENTFVICTLARLSYEKGLDVLIDALAELKKLTDMPFFGIIAGSGPLQEALQGQIKSFGLENNVLLAGRIDGKAEKTELLLGSDLYVNSSRSEAMSMAVLEAMACGLPLVLADTGAVGEIGCGLLVPPEDPKALAQAVKNTMENSNLRTDLSYDSLRSVRAKYSAERMAQAYLDGGKNDR